MRSIAPDDATTRSRIRDHAVALFGRDGFAATSVRAIGDAAGVSAALVIHHFGSKEGLRRACDEHVLAEVMGRKGDLARNANPSAAMQAMLADAEAYRPTLDYLARMILDGSRLGDDLFDAIVASTLSMLEAGVASGTMHSSSDPEMRAVIITAQSLSTLLLERQIGRAFGATGLTGDIVRRMTLPTLELYTDGLYADDTMLAAAAEALARTSGPQSHKGPGNPKQDPDPPGRG